MWNLLDFTATALFCCLKPNLVRFSCTAEDAAILKQKHTRALEAPKQDVQLFGQKIAYVSVANFSEHSANGVFAAESNLRLKMVRAYLIYLKNIMEITLRKGLEPVNAAKDRPNQCLSAASFEKAP